MFFERIDFCNLDSLNLQPTNKTHRLRMSITRLAGTLLLVLFVASQADAHDKHYQELFTKRLDEVTQNFLMLHEVKEIKTSKKLDFSIPSQEEIDKFLTQEFGVYYPGYHPDIIHYIKILSKRPQAQLKIWYTIATLFSHENARLKNNPIAHLIISRLEFPNYSLDDSWLIPHTISLVFGNESPDYVDNRLQVFNNYKYRLDHLNALTNRGVLATHALAACVLGSATITRIPNYLEKNYWQLYPEIKNEHRDFYALMLASAFVHHQIKTNENRYFEIEPKNTYLKADSEYAMHLDVLAHHFKLSSDEMNFMNRKYYKRTIPPKQYFQFPHKFASSFLVMQEDLALKSAYLIHNIKSPFCLIKYRVKSSDNLEQLAKNFSSDPNDILKVNFLKCDAIVAGKTIFIKVKQVDSVFFSSFDALSIDEIFEKRKTRTETEASSSNTSTIPVPIAQKVHVVKSGETLSHISRKYGVSVKQIKDWNKLKSDNIQIGQKLIVKK
jgi:LysM repeat protein